MTTLRRATSRVGLLAIAVAALGCGGGPRGDGSAPLAMAAIPVQDTARLTVTSPAFTDGGDIPRENTQYGNNRFPGLAWTPGPAGTATYVVILQDADGRAPVLHWTIANVDVGTTALEPGMTDPPAGASYGPNIRGAHQAYWGPRTPEGPKHHYHFQVFAIDRKLPADSLDTYTRMHAAILGRVLARGEIVGLGQAYPP